MATEKDELLRTQNEGGVDNPVTLRTQQSFTLKNDPLRRNTSIRNSRYRKPNARLVSKRGDVRVYFKKIPRKSLRYAMDMWTTLVNMQWRWLCLTVALVNILAYFSCGLLFYYDSWISGDFDNETDHLLCIEGVHSFRSFFMLSIETITTTGYGYLHPTEQCRLYYVVFAFSTLTSIFIDGAFISVVYAKLNRPKDKNMYTSIFSKKAVISLRNKKLCFIVRVNDREGKHWINSNIKLYMIKESISQEGEDIVKNVTELELKQFGMLFWPTDIVHEIGPNSPFWHFSAKELITKKFEIVVVVTGSSHKTGQQTRSQTSYLNKEIMWGYRFSPCLEYNSARAEYSVNKILFNHYISQEIPRCSAQVLNNLQKGWMIKRKSLELGSPNWKHLNSKKVWKFNET